MKKLTESKLLAGFIYGDHHTKEYVYLPGSELGADIPVLVYETDPWMMLWKSSKREA